VIEQGETASATFDAIDERIDSMTNAILFSYYKPNSCTVDK
jgi:hypothetical protein